MTRPVCPDCGQSDQMQRGPTGNNAWFIGCIRCQNARTYPTFASMWDAWCALTRPQQPTQPALFEVPA